MIKKLLKLFKTDSEISAFKIIEEKCISNQAFFVLNKLETKRAVETKEYLVTIYINHEEHLGDSTFRLSSDDSMSRIKEKLSTAKYAAKFVFNKPYELVQGPIKKTFKDKPYELTTNEMIEQISNVYKNASTSIATFNALEIFIEQSFIKIVNSNGVNLTKTNHSIFIESIPTIDIEPKVELYKSKKYLDFNIEEIKKDAEDAISDVNARYNATKLENVNSCDVILRDGDAMEFFYSSIANYDYSSVYLGNNDIKIGDMLQNNSKEPINISFGPSSKANAFDPDGVIIKPHKVVENGKLINYYGSNRYGQYLGLAPSGMADELRVSKGKHSIDKLKKGTYLEIIALSGIQIDVFNDYVGGEIRLAIFHEGENSYPVSGLSFSGSFKQSLNSISCSKETIKRTHYFGPKIIKLKNMNIM